MNTSIPTRLAMRGEERADAGLFVSGDALAVVESLRQDLLAQNIDKESLEVDFLERTRRYDEKFEDDPRSGELREDSRSTIFKLLDGKADESDLEWIVRILYFSGQQALLAKHHLRFPAYNILDEYFTNAVVPCGPKILPRPKVPGRNWSLFGMPVGFPIGIPASALTANAEWIQRFANNGYNILTYKTVRSRIHATNPAPNWAFVPDVTKAWPVSEDQHEVVADPWDWVNPGSRNVTTTNSFGVPSVEPREWIPDVENILSGLAPDQLLIVSVMGDDYSDGPAQLSRITADFAATARMAESAGARVVEVNLSCPNSLDPGSGGVRPPICYNTRVATRIIQEVRSTLRGDTRLVAKLSYLDEQRLEKLVTSIAPYVDGVAGINTLQCPVTRADGIRKTFPGRDKAGVSGIAVRDYAKDFVARLARLRLTTGTYFEILGMGGVTDPDSFLDLFELGADAVQSATGTFANPFLASECVEAIGSNLPEVTEINDPGVFDGLKELVTETARSQGVVSRLSLVATLPLRVSQTLSLLDRIVQAGELETVPESPDLYRLAAS
jgi:dihydroorotate dehydrogenase